MNKAVTKKKVWKLCRVGTAGFFEDVVLKEKIVALIVDGREEVSVVLTPGEEDLWALGHLFSRRMILSRNDIVFLEIGANRISIQRKVKRKGLSIRHRFVDTASSCLTEAVKENPKTKDKRLPLEVRWHVPYALVEKAVQNLSAAPLFRQTGSVHVAILADTKGRTLCCVEDVGRHNAVDKAVGWAVKNGVKTMDCFLAVSGRLPADMVCKAFGAQIPFVASISAATASGIEAAERFGITLVGFVREGRMNVYSVPERFAELGSVNGR
ncbi:MAG: formate dehydrogenase accessory sulfurtransferase FdhD [Thermovirgaceae bacterium]